MSVPVSYAKVSTYYYLCHKYDLFVTNMKCYDVKESQMMLDKSYFYDFRLKVVHDQIHI